MLHLALTTLLALQAASAPPQRSQPATEAGRLPGQRAAASSRAAHPAGARRGGPSPTPTPRRAHADPRPEGVGRQRSLVVNKSDNTVSSSTPRPESSHGRSPVGDRTARGRDARRRPGGGDRELRRAGEPGHMVSLIDLATGKVVSRIDIGEGSRPHGSEGPPRRPAARHRRGHARARRRRPARQPRVRCAFRPAATCRTWWPRPPTASAPTSRRSPAAR